VRVVGFEPDNVLVGRVSLPSDSYKDPSSVRAFFDQLRGRVRALPGFAQERAGPGCGSPQAMAPVFTSIARTRCVPGPGRL